MGEKDKPREKKLRWTSFILRILLLLILVALWAPECFAAFVSGTLTEECIVRIAIIIILIAGILPSLGEDGP